MPVNIVNLRVYGGDCGANPVTQHCDSAGEAAVWGLLLLDDICLGVNSQCRLMVPNTKWPSLPVLL